MTVRIETTSITQGREFALYARSASVPTITMFGYDPITNEAIVIPFIIKTIGTLHIASAIAPVKSGYLYATIGNQKIIKRIGRPYRKFNLGYRANYTLPYKAYNKDMQIIDNGKMEEIIDGFYSAELGDDVFSFQVLNKEFLINKELQKMNYNVEIGTGKLNSTVEMFTLPSVVLPTFELSSQQLGSVSLNSTLPSIILEELI